MSPLERTSIALGSAQFGLNYGIINSNGKIEAKDAIKILREAIYQGIEYIDTAAAYGNSEKIIGTALSDGLYDQVKIITKLLPFDEKSDVEDNQIFWKTTIYNCINKSLKNLKISKIDTIMIHRAKHLQNEFIIDELKSMRNKNFFDNIGVSVQTPEELDKVLKYDFISIIQIPLNILDHRWDRFVPKIKKIKKKRKLKIHVRSIFLQGLLIDETFSKWISANIKDPSEIRDWINRLKETFNRQSAKDLCISFLNGLNWIDTIIMGVDNIEQLHENFLLFQNKPLNNMQINLIRNNRPILNSITLDPSKWTHIND